MNSVTPSISLSLSISPPITKPWTQFLPGKCKPLTSSPFNSNFDCKCRALGEGPHSQSQTTQPTVYQGVYGPWTIEDSDIREVILYRSGLVTAAVSFVLASSTALLPNDSVMSNLIEKNLDLLYAFGSCGLGLSLYLIHIYVTEIKRALQALWLLGALGSLATYSTLAQSADKSLVKYVIENPTAVWFVGPLFAALTGLVFKEGLCYGKLEAGILTFVIPSLLLGHLQLKHQSFMGWNNLKILRCSNRNFFSHLLPALRLLD